MLAFAHGADTKGKAKYIAFGCQMIISHCLAYLPYLPLPCCIAHPVRSIVLPKIC